LALPLPRASNIARICRQFLARDSRPVRLHRKPHAVGELREAHANGPPTGENFIAFRRDCEYLQQTFLVTKYSGVVALNDRNDAFADLRGRRSEHADEFVDEWTTACSLVEDDWLPDSSQVQQSLTTGSSARPHFHRLDRTRALGPAEDNYEAAPRPI